MNIVSIWLWLFKYSPLGKLLVIPKLHNVHQRCSPGGVIFFSILAVNIAHYGQLPKTLNLTPPELMRNAG